tara:strand:- start:265 stop:1359 length:1095 start_codon:yes stop_codon:yes gene_type:complete
MRRLESAFMKIVHVFHQKTYNSNGAAFAFPLYYNRQRLLSLGINLKFFHKIEQALFECDALLISQKYFAGPWPDEQNKVLAFLSKVRNSVAQVIWCDISDSTGTTSFNVLPYVTKYLKNQILKDRSAYQKYYYGGRLYTDYYYKHFGVIDERPWESKLHAIPSGEDLKKIQVGWNSGFENYSLHGEKIARLRAIVSFPRWYPKSWQTSSIRKNLISCRVGSDYTRNTVSFHRQQVQTLLADKLPTTKISRFQYLQEMKNSMAVISPFGFGEITLRDFEIVLCGSVALKPCMNHLETWPNLWVEGETYLSWKWDYSDLIELVDSLDSRKKEISTIAENVQTIYRHLLCTEEGHLEFCTRFIKLLE